MPADDRVARSVALEQTYVHDVYEQFSENPKSRPWPRVKEFLEDLEQGSLICDVGCGSGKYMNINTSIFNMGGDKSIRLCEMAKEKENEVILLDNLTLPFRDESLDAVVSIAVVHHLATTERRIRALRELARVLRIGGRIIISVWAMEQSHRKFESQDVLVPWNRPQQLSTPSLELTSTTTTSEDDCQTPYHAYTQSDSDSNRSSKAKSGIKKRGKTRHKGRSIDPGRSSSPSSSSLSSPNETCYSFVRRAIQKLAGGKRGVHRPWFLESWSTCAKESSTNRLEQGACNCCECEDIQNLPIELRRVDDEELPQRRQTFPSSQLINDLYFNLKSRSLTDIKMANNNNNNMIRSKSSVPSIQEALSIEESNDNQTKIVNSKPTKRKLVKQKKSICEEDSEEDLDKPTDMKALINNIVPDVAAVRGVRHRGSVFKQRSLNEDIMSTDRLREKERVKRNIQKQASLNEDLIYQRYRTLDSIKDSFFSVSTSKRFQLIKSGFTNKIKNTNIDKVTGTSLRNGFVRMFQNWKSNEMVSPIIPEDDTLITSPSNINAIISDERKENGTGSEERRHSKEDGSDSSKDSSLQSDTSVDSEDSFASVIFVPKTDPTSPTLLSSDPTSPRVTNTSVPNSPRIKQSSCPTSPRIKQMPLSIYPLTKQLSSPKPSTSTVKSVSDSPLSPPPSSADKKEERDQINSESTIENKKPIVSKTLAQKYAVPHIPKFQKTPLNTKASPEKPTQTVVVELPDSRSESLKHIKELLSKKPGFGVRTVKSNYPIVRRSSMSNGNFDTMARPLPKLLSLELFNPETDDKDSDSSAVSSPDSVDSVVENKNKPKFTFPPTSSVKSNKLVNKKNNNALNNSKSLLEAAASVAHSLDEAVDKVIKSSPRAKRRQLKAADVMSVIQRRCETDSVPLLSAEASCDDDDPLWDVECHKHLTDFADQLSEKLLKEIDQYRTVGQECDGSLETLAGSHISDPYIYRLSEELSDLSKLSEEIQKQNAYLAKLSASDNFYNKLQCGKRTKSKSCVKEEQSEVKKDGGVTVGNVKLGEISKSQTDDALRSKNVKNVEAPEEVAPKVVAKSSTFKNGSSIESCESEKGSSSTNSVISSVATSVHFDLSMESADGTSERGSSDSHKDNSSISRFSDGGSTASLVSCPEWSTFKSKLSDEYSMLEDRMQQKRQCSVNKSKDKSNLNPSLSDTSQESLPSDNMGGAITYHRYYHVFREGELDQLIEKYVQNLHIISSYYDHSSWCVVAEKVQVWTI